MTAEPFDPRAVAEQYRQTAAAVEDTLAHMDTAITAVEAELAIVRYHHAHRQAMHAAEC